MMATTVRNSRTTGIVSVFIDDRDAKQTLFTMGRKSVNAQPLMALAWTKMHKEVMFNFASTSATANIFKHRPNNISRRWKRLSKYTLSRKVAGSILEETGRLKNSMGSIKFVGRQTMKYGSVDGLSAVHQMGAIVKPRRAKVLTLPYPGVTGGPREYKNTYIAGKTIYDKDTGKPLFFFKNEVKIPARPHLNVSMKYIKDMAEHTWIFMTRKQ